IALLAMTASVSCRLVRNVWLPTSTRFTRPPPHAQLPGVKRAHALCRPCGDRMQTYYAYPRGFLLDDGSVFAVPWHHPVHAVRRPGEVVLVACRRAAADPGSLPGKATWQLVTSLPRRGGPISRTARSRQRTWAGLCGSTGSGTGPNRVTTRPRTVWAGPTSGSTPGPCSPDQLSHGRLLLAPLPPGATKPR